jgi:chromosome segregation ATPase
MSRCNRCGKSGLFFKVNTDGKCRECERIEKLINEETDIKRRIDIFTSKRIETEKAYEEIKNTRDSLYNEIASKAKKDALEQIQDQINSKNDELSKIVNSISTNKAELEQVLEKTKESEKTLVTNANKLFRIKEQVKSLQYSIKRYNDIDGIPVKELSKTETEEAEELLSATIKLKLHLMDIRELKKRYSQNNKLIKDLLLKYQSRYTTKANMTIYRLMVIALEAEMQNALFNLSYSKLDKSIKDIKTITAKYQKIATDGNQNIASTITKFIGEIEYLYIEAIKIEYEYYIQKERIKEIGRTHV